MNINEQMNELGQVGSVGYSPTSVVVDQLVGRAKRARAIRQGSAAVIGSLGAISLGLLGAQVLVNLTQDQNAASTIHDVQSFGALKEPGYTGLGKTPEELAAWAKVESAATITPAAPAAAEPTGEEPAPVKPTKPASEIPDGSFLFGNGQVYVCQKWTDTATGTTFWGAYSGTGDWAYKMIQCDPNDKYYYEYNYMGDARFFNTTTRTCTGDTVSYLGAPHKVSCRTNSALRSIYGTWTSANGGNTKWTLNNDAGKILLDSGTYKWFVSGSCIASPSAAVKTSGLHQCEQATCDGGYYRTTDHPTANGHTYSWIGSSWVQDPDPIVTPDPDPIVTPDPDPIVTPDPEPAA